MAATAALRRLAPAAVCAFMLFWGLERPALWQDEAETALLGLSAARHGRPLVRLDGRLISGQPTLAAYESNADGVWIWNTWLPYYAAAASFKIFGPTTWAARAPFALFAFLAFLLACRLFRELATPLAAELASWLLALNVPWLLFMRQCRYYSLASLSLLAAVHAYRLINKRWGPAALGASLTLLFHSFFVMGPLTIAALALDARRGSRKRFWAAAAAACLLALPFALYFQVWVRPGNHQYSLAESAQFLRTFLLWLHQFSAPWPLLALLLGLKGLAAYGVVILLLASESAPAPWVGGALLAVLIRRALRADQPWRLPMLLVAANLLLFSLTGAEPYGRYLAPILPFFCLAAAAAIDTLAKGRRPVAWALAALCAATNVFNLLPWLGEPVETVSGMMRARLRAVPLRSDLSSFLFSLKNSSGYVEEIASVLNRLGRPGESAFSPSDNLSLMFYTKLDFMTPEEFSSRTPDWIIPSPWLALDPASTNRMQELLRGKSYEGIDVAAPLTLWQNNPDILYHAFRPRQGTRSLLHLAKKPVKS